MTPPHQTMHLVARMPLDRLLTVCLGVAIAINAVIAFVYL